MNRTCSTTIFLIVIQIGIFILHSGIILQFFEEGVQVGTHFKKNKIKESGADFALGSISSKIQIYFDKEDSLQRFTLHQRLQANGSMYEP